MTTITKTELIARIIIAEFGLSENLDKKLDKIENEIVSLSENPNVEFEGYEVENL